MNALFRPETAEWFLSSVGTPTQAQSMAFRAIASGQDTLVSSPTGSGKTLAAFLYFLDSFARRAEAGTLKDETEILYITPLKALGNDIRVNLAGPIEGLGLEGIVKTAVRNGDTTPYERQAILKKPPHILITTPESVYLLLSSASGQRLLKTVKHVILDEFHATVSTKRGVHMMLSLARLDALCARPLQRIALSATLTPLSQAADILSCGRPCQIICPPISKKTSLTVDTAAGDMRILPENSIWPHLADRVKDALDESSCVLAFSDGRAGCERLAHKINERAGEIIARTHHGCVSKEQRLEAEAAFKNGDLRVLAATSSMELGIDVGDIDLVIQIGNPLSVSSLMQRLGRAGHSPGRVSRMRIYPKTAQDTLLCALTAKAALDGKIEPVRALEKPFDLLCQHLVSMAATGEYTVSDAAEILKKAHAFRALTEDDVRRALGMLAGDYEHALDHPVRARVLYDRVHDVFKGDSYTSLLALSSGGTIPDRGWYGVYTHEGVRLGELDEEYVFEARIGDKFMLGAFPWVITDITRERVIVQKTSAAGAASPFWKGDGSMRFYETGCFFGSLLDGISKAASLPGKALESLLADMCLTPNAAAEVKRVVRAQLNACGCLATDRMIVLEHFSDEAGEHQLMVHSVFGGRVNRALGMLLAQAASRITGVDARAYDDDDGILICMIGGREVPQGLFTRIETEKIEKNLLSLLPSAPMFSIAFRQNAQRAMLMGARNGRRQPLWIQRLRASEALSDAIRAKDHPLISDTLRECMNDYLDIGALKEVLLKIRSGEIAVSEIRTDEPSPMSLSLRRQAEAELMYETVIPSAARQTADGAEYTLAPEPDALKESYPLKSAPKNAEETHAFLMTTGDLAPGEAEVSPWDLEELIISGRAAYIEPGLWISKEHEADYEKALVCGDKDALASVVRRLARYKGALNAQLLCARYGICEETAEEILRLLSASGALVPFGGLWVHKDVYKTAQIKTVSALRNRVQTVPCAHYAGALVSRVKKSGTAENQTENALSELLNEKISPEILENCLLCARIDRYKPSMLDSALAKGCVQYTLSENGQSVFFHAPEDETDEFTAPPEGLTPGEEAVLRHLRTRGASFARSLNTLAPGGAGNALLSLLRRGLVRCDSFSPIRYLVSGETGAVKLNVRRRVQAADAGRWEAVRVKRRKTPEETLEEIFDRFIIACRETAQGAVWSELAACLRRMEYAGQVRRGYFVQGLSGAQFVREADYHWAVSLLASPECGYRILSACDPMQPYGKILPHAEGRAFTRLPSCAPLFYAGDVVAVFEKNGETLRVFDFSHVQNALMRFVKSFRLGEIFPSHRKITVKQYPSEVRDALLSAGFQPDLLSLTLFKIE